MHAEKKETLLQDPSLLTGKLPIQNTTWEMKKLHVANTKQFIEHQIYYTYNREFRYYLEVWYINAKQEK